MKPTAVVFDIGNVLVDWQPHLAWIDEMGSRGAVEAFMARTGFFALNARADAGERFADLAQEVDDPADRRRVAAYVAQYSRTVARDVPGTWALLERLKAKGVPTHAITNWSAETWPEGLKTQPRLGTAFETLVISGVEKLAKPDPAIFHLFCDRAGLAPAACLFVDDKLENVDAARGIGMDAVHFTSAPAFEAALQERDLL